MSVGLGVSPFGHGTPTSALPADMTALTSLVVSQNVSWQWTDDAPGVTPPATGPTDARRTRFIYDFFLSRERPNGTNVAASITDEVTINLASNAHFPGSQPPGCLDPNSRFGNSTTGPLLRNAVWDGTHHYDFF